MAAALREQKGSGGKGAARWGKGREDEGYGASGWWAGKPLITRVIWTFIIFSRF
jgi:hypothetical protein